jgi:hypothetical protein
MNRFALSALAMALLAAPAAAIPPPPEVAVLVLSPGGADPGPINESDELLAAISPAEGGGWLRVVDPAFNSADFAACTSAGVADEGCVREVLAARGSAQMTPQTVVVLIGPGPGFSISWTCVGVGERAFQPERQRISIDFLGWRAEGRFSPEQVSEAAGCLTSAAAESGW